ncbi:amidohydrolase [Pseudoclavibacter sp. VKM Ac-2867]|uniref:amidohydrolase n=1 Tax=Pseudoclavibacter sp. VKM Ac-2867 TaxID=2783829 RepID=UPI00188BC9C4|nr:amidohydrolase [Pseudoclavibacter sp. VKM Ac-2867]MBF4460128.1 amidohydrolase [Pseudoclavibacter sp. VKM Ac-2867]
MKIDLVIEASDIITMDERRPQARRLGIHQGRVVGLDEDLDGVEATRRVDLGEVTVIPGIIDAHCHTTWFGRTQIDLDLSRIRTVDEALTLIAAHTETVPAGEWVQAAGYNQHLVGGAYPDLASLDAVTAGRPAVIKQSSGHAVIANTEALRRSGALHASDPDGGRIERDSRGQVTGRLEETAQALVLDLLKPMSHADIVRSLDLATSIYASEGITSFTEAGIGAGWIGNSTAELGAYQMARDCGVLRARAQVMPTLDSFELAHGNPATPGSIGLSLGARTGLGDDRLRLGPLKLFVDGSLTGRTAAMSAPYCGEPDNTGFLQGDAEDITRKILAAAASGWSIAAHAIGDAAIDLAMDAIEASIAANGTPSTPHRIEHASYLRDDQLPRLARLGIAVTPQAMFVHRFGDEFVKSMGQERVPGIYRARSLLDAGVLVAGSSDRPCIDGNPFLAMRTLIERRTASGQEFAPQERLTAQQALASYTRDAAKATGSRDTGSLWPGQLADLAVLDRSPLTSTPDELSKTRVLTTLVGGKPTHGDL